jgi:putative ABC transport system permease protein
MSLVGIGFGLAPAIRAARTDLRGAMSASGRGATLDRSTRRLLGSLVVGEIAIAAALLMASATATQYFQRLVEEPWGFATERRSTFKVMLSDRLFATADAKQRALDTTITELRALPGVREATVTSPSPMNAPRNLIGINPDGAQPPQSGAHLAYLRSAPAGYLKTIGQPLIRGRDFNASDAPDAPPVCIVNESFARRFWPNEGAIGKRVKWGRLDGPRPWLTVVGVTSDMKVIADPRDGEVVGTIMRPLSQLLASGVSQMNEMTFVVETATGASLSEPAMRAVLSRADPRLAGYELVSLEEAAAQTRVTERFIFMLLSLFGGLGLVLAAVGLYGLLALQVARRQREFGIRSALGATATQLIQLVARQGARLLAAGFIAGGVVTFASVRLAQSRWSEMPAPNVVSWLAAAVVLAVAVALASWRPARRAARVDPIAALRSE